MNNHIEAPPYKESYNISTILFWFKTHDWLSYCLLALMGIIITVSIIVIIRAQILKYKQQENNHLRKINSKLILLFTISSAMWITQETRYPLFKLPVNSWSQIKEVVMGMIYLFYTYIFYSLVILFILISLHTMVFYINTSPLVKIFKIRRLKLFFNYCYCHIKIILIIVIFLITSIALWSFLLSSIEFTREIPTSLTRTNMHKIQYQMRRYKRDSGILPKSLKNLKVYIQSNNSENDKKSIFLDGWDRPIIYKLGKDGNPYLLSLGADNQKGGIGDNEDIEMQLSFPDDCNTPPTPRR